MTENMTTTNYRAPRWDTDTQKRFLVAIRLGESIRGSCRLAGCSSETVYAWLARGEVDGEGEHRAFLEAVTSARISARLRLTKIVAKAARSDWRAAVAYLRVLDPGGWGGRDLQLEGYRRRKARAEAEAVEDTNFAEGASRRFGSGPPSDYSSSSRSEPDPIERRDEEHSLLLDLDAICKGGGTKESPEFQAVWVRVLALQETRRAARAQAEIDERRQPNASD